LEKIQAEMKNASFSEDMAIFQELRQKIPPFWLDAWQGIRVQSYLNAADMKEFSIED
jgi:hypothetical protein